MPIINRIAEFHEEMKGWRQHLHSIPEEMFDLPKTSAFVIERLKEIGVDELHEGIAETGIVAIINGKEGPDTIGLRADMDALPITEMRDLPYKSTHEGSMHACGHDGHTSMLLGAAKYLAETRNFSGRVALIFQPAEEGGGGGKIMCDEGVMDRFNIKQVFGIHNWPNKPVGDFATRTGALMAAADQWDIEIIGRGSHAAMPQESVDPIPVAAQVVSALQTIISRNINPLDTAVLTVTQFHAGTAYNIIPEKASLSGTLRTLDKTVRDDIVARMKSVVENIANAHGAKGVFNFDLGYPPTVNHAHETEFGAKIAVELVGENKVDIDTEPSMGAEDFSYMLEHRPGAYFFLGQGDSAGLHHPEYDFNDEILPIGASFFVKLVEGAQPVR